MTTIVDGKSCVYWIHHPEHTDMFTQGYIGVTKRFERRIWEHLVLSGNRYLKNAIKKYGWDNLIKEKVIISDEDYCLSIELQLRSTDKIGWNLVKGGGMPPVNRWNKGTKGLMVAWNKGLNWSDEVKQKLSVGVKKLWENPEYRQHMSDAHKGKVSARKGVKLSKEIIDKIVASKTGKPSWRKGIKATEEQIQKFKDILSKQAWTCPHCNKQGKGKGTGNRWHFDNCKEKNQ